MSPTTEVLPLLAPGRTLGVIGAGVMGQTLLKGILDTGLVTSRQVWAAAKTQSSCDEVAAALDVVTDVDYRPMLPNAGIILICVKPTQIGAVADILKKGPLRSDTLLISILGGVTIERLESMVSKAVWLRAMPNTPCLVRQGMTVVCAGKGATDANLQVAQRMFSSVGECMVLEEQHLNAVTAISGCGPAYMYLVIEALADAGVRVGLPRHVALDLVTQTMLGAARMVIDTKRHPASLRDDVTTPAGSTIGGLLMLEDGKIRSVLARAVEEAARIVEERGRVKG